MRDSASSRQEVRRGSRLGPVAAQAKRQIYYLSEAHLSSTRYKLCSFMISFYRKLLLVDPNNIHPIILTLSVLQREHKGNSASQRRVKAKDVWPIVGLTIYILTTVKLCVYVYLKYQQDSYRFRLDHLKRSINSTNDDVASRAALHLRLAEYSEELHDIWAHLKQIGDPYTESRFIAQVGAIILIVVTFILYVWTQIVIIHTGKFENSLTRFMIYEPEEYACCQKLIDLELKRLANSSRNFLHWTCQLGEQGSKEFNVRIYKQLEIYDEHIQFDSSPNEAANGQVRRLGKHCDSICFSEMDGLARYYQDHCTLMRLLVQLKRNHELHPINRVSDEWTSQNERQFLKMNMTNSIYSIILDTIFIYVGHLFTNYKLEFVTITDRLLIVELYFYCFVGIFATNYHMSLLVIDCDDKTRYLHHTRQQLVDCIRDNDRDFAILHARLVDGMGPPPTRQLFDTCSDKLNSRVIRAYLQYRIFSAELHEVHTFWSFSIVIGMVLMFAMPIFARVYIPYITDVNANMVVLGFVFSVGVFTDLFMMPLCKFSKYGGDTYKTLCSLLAQCMELQAKSRLELAYGPIYMEHTIDVLRKELDDPGKFLNRFTASYFGFTATFPKLVELRIYNGLIILSLFCEFSSWRTLFGGRLDDPLALLKSQG